MDEDLNKISTNIELQKVRFRKGLGADLSFLILILILIFVNIYTGIKTDGNPTEARILIYVVLYFFLGWCVYEIVKNSLGMWGLDKTDDLLGNIRTTKSDAMKIPTTTFLSGFFYEVIDKNISTYVAPLTFHLKKKKANLVSLNFRYFFWDVLLVSTGIAMFVGEVIYYKGANFDNWESIIALVAMIVLIVFTIAYLVPRQIIVNRQIKLDDKKKISEAEYFDSYKCFYVEKVLTKFWNRN